MAAITVQASTAPIGLAHEKRWRLPHYFAVVGALFLVWEAWTLTAWLADGPHAVSQFRVHHGASWWGARTYEVLTVTATLVIATWVVRTCWRERRLTFDAKLCIATTLSWWLDPFVNFFQPVQFYSSQFVNLNSWLGHVPFVANPDAGRLPQPIVFQFGIYVCGVFAFTVFVMAAMRAVRRRWPSATTARVALAGFAAGLLVDLLLEPIMYRLHLLALPGTPNFFALWSGSSYKFPLFELIWAGMIPWLLALIRLHKDDRGHTVLERGLDGHSPRLGNGISVLACIGAASVIMCLANTGPAIVGLYSAPYRAQPAHLSNDMCDVPGITGTRYGPCPGSPGYRAPIRHLPDASDP